MPSSLEEKYQRIQNYFDEGKLLEAYHACLEILRFDPDNIKVIRLKNKVEKAVQEKNRKSIEKDLALLEPLWEQQKYEEILYNLKKLEPYINDFPQIKDLIIKAQTGYQKKNLKKSEITYQDESEKILKLVKEKKFHEALIRVEVLQQLNLNQSETEKLLKKIKSSLINFEIESNQGLIKSDKYKEILIFYQNLLKIDKDSSLLKKLLKTSEDNYKIHLIENKKEFIYKGLEAIQTLFQLKKYQKAVEAAKEILEIDPFNKIAKKLFYKANNKTISQIKKEVISQMLKAQIQSQKEYQENKSSIKKI